MKSIVIVETDQLFVNKIKRKFNANKLDDEYDIVHVSPNPTHEQQPVNEILEQVDNAIIEIDNVVSFFVDIVLHHSPNDLDSYGLEVAYNIKKRYPHLPCYCITSMVNSDPELDIFSEATLSNVDGVLAKSFLIGKGFTRGRLDKLNHSLGYKRPSLKSTIKNSQPSCDLLLLTALYEDEHEAIKNIIEDKVEKIEKKRILTCGSITTATGKKINVVLAHQDETGIVDAAIVATDLMNKLKPSFLIMPGVCGGDGNKVKLKDIVIAKKTSLFQKGKEGEDGFQRDSATATVDPVLISKIQREKRNIQDFLRDSDKTTDIDVDIFFDTMGCSLSVINKKDYFANTIKIPDRNTIAVDMESYSIVRACEIANDGETSALIIKSVMDTTDNKNDNVKKHASHLSAQTVQYVVKNVLFN